MQMLSFIVLYNGPDDHHPSNRGCWLETFAIFSSVTNPYPPARMKSHWFDSCSAIRMSFRM